jgi:hypothetical protein
MRWVPGKDTSCILARFSLGKVGQYYMKTNLIRIFSLVFFLSGCGAPPFPAANATRVPIVATPIVPDATATILSTPTIAPQKSTMTPYPSTPTFISAPLPRDLSVAYVVEDALWIWKKNNPQLLIQRPNISAPVFSDDGQWLLFRQRLISINGGPASEEVWVIRTDGTELHRLVGSDDLKALTGEEALLLIDDISWLPNRHEVLFNTEKIIEGPPGSSPLFDLYSMDLSGEITRLLDPDQGGNFMASPTGTYVALVTNSSIGVLDLESGEQRTLFEFEPVGIPSDNGLPTPEVIWDPEGRFVMTTILPRNLYYPDKYAGEPTQVWRLFVNGHVELVAELQLVAPFTGIVFSPNLQYFFYLDNSCFDGMGMLYLHNLESGAEYSLDCVWNLPQWAPDSEHFIYQLDWFWQLGSIIDNINQPLDVLNVPPNPNARASAEWTWINSEYFLLFLRSEDICTLNVATLQGVVTEVANTPADVCPWMFDFNLSR